MKLMALTLAAALLAGCATTTTQTDKVERKAAVLTSIAANHVLANKPESLPKFRLALESLRVLQGKEVIGINEVLAIILLLPPDALGKDSGIYIADAILFFSDDLETLAVKNPDVARAAVRGMIKGLERVLP